MIKQGQMRREKRDVGIVKKGGSVGRTRCLRGECGAVDK